jgi:ubiquinone/menaquinone biosynthesis C-methylase UbiE
MQTEMPGDNYGLREDIKAYWSARAETFDLSPGHEIFTDEEMAAWRRLILKHLGEAGGRLALDLASGTGVISHLMDGLGFQVTGLDWAEPMLEKARLKAKARQRPIRFRMADVENTMEADDAYDVIITRHLVWTLVDPSAAFAEWLRVLKPGGRILIVDGDFVNVTRTERALKAVAKILERIGWLKPDPMHAPPGMMEAHHSIVSRVHFSNGARAEQVAELVAKAGFTEVQVDTDLRDIHKAQSRHWNALKALGRGTQHRFAVTAKKPIAGEG